MLDIRCRDFVLPGMKQFQKRGQIVHVQMLTLGKIVRDVFGYSFLNNLFVTTSFLHLLCCYLDRKMIYNTFIVSLSSSYRGHCVMDESNFSL